MADKDPTDTPAIRVNNCVKQYEIARTDLLLKCISKTSTLHVYMLVHVFASQTTFLWEYFIQIINSRGAVKYGVIILNLYSKISSNLGYSKCNSWSITWY